MPALSVTTALHSPFFSYVQPLLFAIVSKRLLYCLGLSELWAFLSSHFKILLSDLKVGPGLKGCLPLPLMRLYTKVQSPQQVMMHIGDGFLLFVPSFSGQGKNRNLQKNKWTVESFKSALKNSAWYIWKVMKARVYLKQARSLVLKYRWCFNNVLLKSNKNGIFFEFGQVTWSEACCLVCC